MSSIHNNGITARRTLAGLKASWHNTDTSDVFNDMKSQTAKQWCCTKMRSARMLVSFE
jgi:hypothetical protein